MKKIYLYIAFVTTLLVTVVLVTPVQKAGDIAEYYGMTESLVNHGGITLQPVEQKHLESVLHPAYFTDPEYYVAGRDGARWPVHFFFYSLIALPIRLMLQLFGMNELYTLSVTNILILTVTALFVVNNFLKTNRSRVLFLLLLYVSPLLFFITWPGPDLLYCCLLLVSIFYFFEKKYFTAAILAGMASWQSQPLIIITLFMALYFFDKKKSIIYRLSSIIFLLGIIVLPYLYNLYAFGALTPWTRFENGWTLINGFGIQNIRIGKLYEQFFDPNIGLFWWAPLLGSLSLYVVVQFLQSMRLTTLEVDRHKFDKLILFGAFILTAFFYQTNPAWHYGTAGYGPTRHILFFIPLLIVYIASSWPSLTRLRLPTPFDGVQDQPQDSGVSRLGGLPRMTIFFLVFIQLFVLSLNGFATPNFENTLHNSPFATLILNTVPQLYSPTPELFVDRTNHTDIDHPTSAVYKQNEKCIKAYILQTDEQLLLNECGTMPDRYKGVLDNEFLRKANYTRAVKTTEATLWPDSKSCNRAYEVKNQSPYICLETIDDVMNETGVTDKTRISKIAEFPSIGVWKIKPGKALTLTIPPGYIVNHSALSGIYVTY